MFLRETLGTLKALWPRVVLRIQCTTTGLGLELIAIKLVGLQELSHTQKAAVKAAEFANFCVWKVLGGLVAGGAGDFWLCM